MSKKEFYFYPNQEEIFKKKAKNNFVFTLVYNKDKSEIVFFFVRTVSSEWKQSCKNNIESDKRIIKLQDSNYKIYSWIAKDKNDFSLPFFLSIGETTIR